jgi:hypothetical protein
MKPTVNLILPCYNPPSGWDTIVLWHYMKLQSIIEEVELCLTIVNDGSECNMEEETLKRLASNIPDVKVIGYHKNKGKGHALRYALYTINANSTIEYAVYTDWDFPFELENIKDMITMLLNGADVVVGKRNDTYYEQLSSKRKIMSIASKWLNKYILGIPDCDAQSGLKGMSCKGCEIFLQTKIERFLFDTEFVLKAFCCESICFQILPIQIRSGIIMSNMGVKVLRKEFLNFLRILFRCV